MSLSHDLTSLVSEAFIRIGLDPSFGEVVPSNRPELSQFQCNGAMAAAKSAGKNPREIAALITSLVKADSRIGSADMAGPGFINLNVTDDTLAKRIMEMSGPRAGIPPVEDSVTVVVDYAGPNVAKAMHVGHIRATIIGDSLARLFSFAGHRVIRDPHFGDWGLQMGQLIAAISEEQPELPYFADPLPDSFPEDSPVTLDDLQRIYPEAAARTKQDPVFAEKARLATVALQGEHPGYFALWKHMKRVSEESQRRDFHDLGVDFDVWYGESDVRSSLPDLVARLEKKGLARRDEGAVVVRVDRPDDNREWPPLFLETSVGGYVYATTDLATLEHRVSDFGAQLVLYVVDARQADHFEQVFRVAEAAQLVPSDVKMEHIKFGTMNGKDGKPFKTREGGVIRLRDLIEMVRDAASLRLSETGIAQDYPVNEKTEIAHKVGIAALKFSDLINNRTSDYIFDIDRFTSFEGKTGPYLQYGAVRIKSILRNTAEKGFVPGDLLPPQVEAEKNLMLQLDRIDEVLNRTIELRAPNHLAEYAYDLTATFSRFYDSCHVLNEPDSDRRSSLLRLVETTLTVLELSLGFLGIEVPDRM